MKRASDVPRPRLLPVGFVRLKCWFQGKANVPQLWLTMLKWPWVLHHLGQIGAPRVALVADARGALAGAVGGERFKPRDDRAVAAVAIDQAVQGIKVCERGAERAGAF